MGDIKKMKWEWKKFKLFVAINNNIIYYVVGGITLFVAIGIISVIFIKKKKNNAQMN